MPRVYVVEGNIGVGKSTTLDSLRAKGYVVVPEPVEKWVSSGALEGYYKGDIDPFTFQCFVLQTKIDALRTCLMNAHDDTPVIMERGFVGDAKVFLRYNLEKGTVSDFQYSVYQNLMDTLVAALRCKFGGVVYLTASPETCYERVKKRNREGEEGIELEFLRTLNAYYEDVIAETSSFIRVDTEKDVSIDKIEEFVRCSDV